MISMRLRHQRFKQWNGWLGYEKEWTAHEVKTQACAPYIRAYLTLVSWGVRKMSKALPASSWTLSSYVFMAVMIFMANHSHLKCSSWCIYRVRVIMKEAFLHRMMAYSSIERHDTSVCAAIIASEICFCDSLSLFRVASLEQIVACDHRHEWHEHIERCTGIAGISTGYQCSPVPPFNCH